MGASLDDRFWSKVKRDPEGCWEWTGYRHPQWGYGHFGMHGSAVNAQRVAWTLAEGEIPEGMHVLHHCDNPPCVRPSHLFLGTNADNVKDRCQKMRTRNGDRRGERAGGVKLTWAQVEAIRASSKMGVELAKEYGMSRAAISLIRSGKRWA